MKCKQILAALDTTQRLYPEARLARDRGEIFFAEIDPREGLASPSAIPRRQDDLTSRRRTIRRVAVPRFEEITRVDEDPSARRQTSTQACEQLPERRDPTGDADRLHPEEKRVEPIEGLRGFERHHVEDPYLAHATSPAERHAERAHVDRDHLEPARLESEGMATGSGSDVEDPTASLIQGKRVELSELAFEGEVLLGLDLEGHAVGAGRGNAARTTGAVMIHEGRGEGRRGTHAAGPAAAGARGEAGERGEFRSGFRGHGPLLGRRPGPGARGRLAFDQRDPSAEDGEPAWKEGLSLTNRFHSSSSTASIWSSIQLLKR